MCSLLILCLKLEPHIIMPVGLRKVNKIGSTNALLRQYFKRIRSSMNSILAYFLTTDKAIITKLERNIKQIKLADTSKSEGV